MQSSGRTLTEAVFGVPDPPMTSDEEAGLAERIDLVLHTLDPREAYVVRQRYIRRPPLLFEELASRLGVSRSRASQVEANALRKLRLRWRSGHLRPGVAVERTLASLRGRRPPVPPPPALEFADVPIDIRLRLLIELEDVSLGGRARGVVGDLGLVFLGDLARMTEVRLLRCRRFGRTTLKEVRNALAAYGLHLGYEVARWEETRAEALARRDSRRGETDEAGVPSIAGRPTVHHPSGPGTTPMASPVPVDSVRPEVAGAVLNRLLALRPELRDLAQRISESVVAVLDDEPRGTRPKPAAQTTPDPTPGE